MAILLTVSDLSKSYGARPLFSGITFSIESGERVGLIGPNGAGKSTLLRILSSQVTSDNGILSTQRGLRIGFLEQTPTFLNGATVQSTILEGSKDPDDWESMALAHEIISKLSLEDPEREVQSLSGGWKKRVALARELMRQPDLLLLDEPTNHLDVESILWLEAFLKEAAFASLTISHDRWFLQKTVTRILELDRRNPGGLLSIKGDYEAYTESKSLLIAAQERREVVLKNTLRRETEWLKRGAKARTTKQQARIQRAELLGDEVSELEYRNQDKKVRLDFQSSERNPKRLVEAKKISKSFSGKKVLSDLSLILTPGTRLGILGPNGCGKSTLVRCLVGEDTPDIGEVNRAENLSIAYFQQNREALDPLLTLSKTICPEGDFVEFQGNRIHIRSYLDRFLFSQDQMEMAVGKLSGGEQSRVLIAQLMLQPANFLVLDEPTNDLDLATLAVLEDCLTEFKGAVVLVTHDRYFLDQVATHLLAFSSQNSKNQQKNEVVLFSSLEQWEEWHQQQIKIQKQNAKNQANEAIAERQTGDKNSVRNDIKKKKLSFKEQRELDSMEPNIQLAEQELLQLAQESNSPEASRNPKRLHEITEQMTKIQNQIDLLYSRWSKLEEQV